MYDRNRDVHTMVVKKSGRRTRGGVHGSFRIALAPFFLRQYW